MRTRVILSTLFMGFGLAAGSLYLLPQYLRAQQDKSAPNGAGVHSPWTQAQVLQPADLNRTLGDRKTTQPKIFNVGFEILYKSKHIPGSIYAGPGSKDAGIEALKLAVAHVPKDSQIILYCGCCPWDHCPNMKPAFTLLRGMGFKQIKVLEIPTNFSKDWIDPGFPVEGATASNAPAR